MHSNLLCPTRFQAAGLYSAVVKTGPTSQAWSEGPQVLMGAEESYLSLSSNAGMTNSQTWIIPVPCFNELLFFFCSSSSGWSLTFYKETQ